MPLVVRELVIRATLSQEKKAPEEEAKQLPAVKREKLVGECVDQVLEMLEEREER